MQKATKQVATGSRYYKSNEGIYKSLLPVAAFIAILVINCIFTKNFRHIEIRDGQLFGSIIDVGKQATPEILMALAMTLVIATKGIDLSVGAIAAIAGAVAAPLLIAPNGPSLGVILVLSLGAAVLAGIWNGILVSYLRLQPFIATLILMVAGRGIAQMMTDGMIITLPETSAKCNAFVSLGNGSFMFIPARYYVVAAMALITWFLARKTVLGTYVASVGANETAAKYCGIATQKIKIFVYAFSGLCAGMAGLLLTAEIRAADANTVALRDNNEVGAILAVIIGGTAFAGGKFNLLGSVVGALIVRTLIIQVFSSGSNWGYSLVLKAAIVVVVCLVQSPQFRAAITGVFKRRTA